VELLAALIQLRPDRIACRSSSPRTSSSRPPANLQQASRTVEPENQLVDDVACENGFFTERHDIGEPAQAAHLDQRCAEARIERTGDPREARRRDDG
jgi:hypothetical protein